VRLHSEANENKRDKVIQRSSIYRCGYTLRQTRIREIRWDKSADEADDLRRVRTIYKELHG